MIKKILLCIFALAQLLCANMNVDYAVTVGGRELPGTFTRRQLDRCGEVSLAAVEEIARGRGAPAEYDARARITFRPADGDIRALSDALITGSSAVMRCCAVYADGKYVGTVSDPEIIENSLHNYYAATRQERLSLRPVYGCVREYQNTKVAALAKEKLT